MRSSFLLFTLRVKIFYEDNLSHFYKTVQPGDGWAHINSPIYHQYFNILA